MDIQYMIQQMQLQKVIGELNALKASYYDPMKGNTELYKKADKIIKDIINELDNSLG